MIRAVGRENLDIRESLVPSAWAIAGLLSLALIGMVHDLEYANAFGSTVTEEGGAIESQGEFQHNAAAAKLHRKVGLVALLSAGAVCLLTTPRGLRLPWNAITVLVVLSLAWALASVGWSIDVRQTVRELVRLGAYVFVAAALARRFDPRSLCLVLTAAFAGSVIAAVAVEVFTGGFRPWVPGYRLTGSMHSNGIGAQSMVVALAAWFFAGGSRHRTAWWALFAAAAIVVVLSKSRASLATGVVGLAAIHLLHRPGRGTVLTASTAASLVAIAMIAASVSGVVHDGNLSRVVSMGRSESSSDLSGRFPLWQIVWHEADGRRLEGFGYGAFWTVDRTESFHSELGWYAHHAHSAYLEVVVQLGLVGLAMLAAIVVLAMWQITCAIRASGKVECLVLGAWLIAAVVNGLAETAFVTPRDMGLLSAAVVLCCARFGAADVTAGAVTSSERLTRSRAADERFRLPGIGGAAHE